MLAVPQGIARRGGGGARSVTAGSGINVYEDLLNCTKTELMTTSTGLPIVNKNQEADAVDNAQFYVYGNISIKYMKEKMSFVRLFCNSQFFCFSTITCF